MYDDGAGTSASACCADKAVPWGVFLRSRPVWAIIVAHFSYNWCAAIKASLMTWELGFCNQPSDP